MNYSWFNLVVCNLRRCSGSRVDDGCFMLQGLSLVLVQRKEKTMLVAFGGKGSEFSNQVLAFLSVENYTFLRTSAGIFNATLVLC